MCWPCCGGCDDELPANREKSAPSPVSVVDAPPLSPATPSSSVVQPKKNDNKKPLRILCLHGFRTSGAILSMQVAAFQYHTGWEGVFPDAPFPATGPSDPLIAEIYEGYPCYEWCCRARDDPEKASEQIQTSLDYLTNYLAKHGPFDGILGFSQGSAVVTLLLTSYAKQSQPLPVKFAILIGGVDPTSYVEQYTLAIPSLHLMGEADEYKPRSAKLATWYEDAKSISFNEGHNIPSIRCGIYPQISQWLDQFRAEG